MRLLFLRGGAFHAPSHDGDQGTLAGHYCWFVNEGFKQAYEELDPNLEMTYAKSMTKGDSHCEHVFRYRNRETSDRPEPEDDGRSASAT